MVIKKILGLTNLLTAQIFYIQKLTNVIIVSKNKNLMFVTF